jgi:DMSO/TMAO reductase YedYZ molybdopterin-dependent catalytic subunit
MRRLIALCAAIAALVAGVVVATGVAGATGTRNNTRSVEGGPGTFAITGNVKHRLVLNTAVLSRVPSKTLTVTYKSGSATETHTFTGPLLREVLELAGPQFDPAIKNDKLNHYVSATGSDGYQALVAWGEFDPDFGNEDILLAVTQDGQSLADAGPRLVVPGDARGGRYVSGVVRVRLDRGR